jgi:hypothetical protein
MSQRQPMGELEIGFFGIIGIVVVMFLLGLADGVGYLITGKHFMFHEQPPKPPIEEVREKREESYNAGGKAVGEFFKGVIGVDHKKPDTPPPQPQPEKK